MNSEVVHFPFPELVDERTARVARLYALCNSAAERKLCPLCLHLGSSALICGSSASHLPLLTALLITTPELEHAATHSKQTTGPFANRQQMRVLHPDELYRDPFPYIPRKSHPGPKRNSNRQYGLLEHVSNH